MNPILVTIQLALIAGSYGVLIAGVVLMKKRPVLPILATAGTGFLFSVVIATFNLLQARP